MSLTPIPRRLLASVAVLATVFALASTPANAAPASAAPGAPAAATPTDPVLSSRTLTLVTGDEVTVDSFADGRQSFAVDPAPRPNGTPDFTVTNTGGDTYVYPSDTAGLVPSVLDRQLFNVTRLLAYGYTDGIPVITTQPGGSGTLARTAGIAVTRNLPSIGGAAATIAPDGQWWRSTRAGVAARSVPGKVWLDGQVRASLAESVPQIGAPQAWAAGYDGTGVTVAVLDTGIDAAHPDLVGKVVGAADFSGSGATADRNGHGTHVSGIITGSGAGSAARYRGVAPGAKLLNGKVLNDFGFGGDSEIIAGMEWAVANGADVINMSLGGPPTDGTDPMSMAVNRLTATHGVLFVIAAGNSGPGASSVGTPGSADAALTVGSVDKSDRLAGDSSVGPRFRDNAIKPELTAPGVGIVSARSADSQRPVVDQHYTQLSGTSMAAPHTAGAAAVLLQQDPALTAAALKSRLMSTSRPPDQPYAIYQHGAGRLDLAAAVHGTVTAAPAKVEFGVFAYPHDGAAPVQAQVTFTGRGGTPVTLDLSAQAGNRTGTTASGEMLSVSPSTLTVAPGQSATATVTLDVRQGELGLYGGYLRAVAAGQTVAVVPVGFHKEEQLHTLTVNGISHYGQPVGINSTLQVVNVDGTRVFGVDAEFVNGTATMRVPPGVYGVTGGLSSAAGDGVSSDEFSIVSKPEVVVRANTTVLLDARAAAPISVATPAHPESAPRRVTLAYHRRGGESFAWTLWLRSEWQRLYAMPTDPVTMGEFEFLSHWRIGVPQAALELVTPAAPLDLRTYLLPSSPYLNGDRPLRLVDAKAGSVADFQAVDAKDAIALVTFGDVSTVQQERNAAAAGAAALAIAYDVSGQMPAYGVGENATVPTLSLSKENGDALRALLAAGEVTLRVRGQRDTDYLYEVVYPERGRVPATLSYRADPAGLATVRNAFHADTADALITDIRDMWRPWMNFSVVFVNDMRGPQPRTEYLNPDDTRYSQSAGPSAGWLREYTTRYLAGQRRDQTWGKPPVRTGVRLGSPHEAARPAHRNGDRFVLELPEWIDADGHYGNQGGADTSAFRLFQNGVLIGQAARPRGQFPVAAEPANYRLEVDVARTDPAWLTATRHRTQWTVDSARPAAGTTAALPLLLVDYGVPLNLRNTAPAGAHVLRVGVAHQPGVAAPAPVREVRLWISRDDGGTWQELPAAGGGDFHVPAAPRNDPSGYVSIRVEAADAAGNRVTQEVTRAWRAAPAGAACDRTITGTHKGPLVVAKGVTCLAEGSTVTGPVVVHPGAGLIATGATVRGPITAVKASVLSLTGSQLGGPVIVFGSRTGDQLPVLSGNAIAGPLVCLGNEPAPTNLGTPNRVRGPATGQCRGL